LVAQFFIVISAMGALEWYRDPSSRKAPWLFFSGAVLQLISGFYFFWFWVWTLGIYGIYLIIQRDRRSSFQKWIHAVPKTQLFFPIGLNLLLAFPFLYHYGLAAKEFGRRDWVSISNTVPRIYSWINLPNDHWEWMVTPLKSLIIELPRLQEHYLSFGLLTWIGMISALIWIFRRKTELKYLTIPLITMFLFTLTSGRFSTWVMMSYFFPGGGVIRAVSRIQIFMLMFWSLIFISFLSDWWNSSEVKKKIVVVSLVIALLGESTYINNWNFSRSQDRERLEKISKNIPDDCQIIVNPSGFMPHSDFLNIDMVMIAFQTNRMTANGYSGHEPKDYRDSAQIQKWNTISELDGKKVCKYQ